MIRDGELPALIAQGRIVVGGALRRPGDDTPIESFRVLDRPLPELIQDELMRGALTPSELAQALGVQRDDTRSVILGLMNDASLIARGFVLRRTDRVGLPDGRKGTEFRCRLVPVPLPLRIFDPMLGFSLLGWLPWLEASAAPDCGHENDDLHAHRIAQWWELPVERVAETLEKHPHRMVDSSIGPIPVLDDPSPYEDGARLLQEGRAVLSPLRFQNPTLDLVIASIESLMRARSFSVRESMPAILSLADAMNFCNAFDRPEYRARLAGLNQALFHRFCHGRPMRIRSSRICEKPARAPRTGPHHREPSPRPAEIERHTWTGEGATAPGPQPDGVVFPPGFVRCTVRRQHGSGTVALLDEADRTVSTLTQGQGNEEEVHLVVLKKPRRLGPRADVGGRWEVTAEQWVAEQDSRLPWSEEGHGKGVTRPVLFPEGMVLIDLRHSGPHACMIDLIAESGSRRRLCRIPAAGSRTLPVFIADEDCYVFDIWAAGDWSVTAKKVRLGHARELPKEYEGWSSRLTKLFRPRLSSFAMTASFMGNGPLELVLHNARTGESRTIVPTTEPTYYSQMIPCVPGDPYLFEIRTDTVWKLAMTDDDLAATEERTRIVML